MKLSQIITFRAVSVAAFLWFCCHKTIYEITSSKKHQDDQRVGAIAIEELYARHWRKLSDQAPPRNEIVIVGTASGALPIHERWWITKGHGLRMGTSYSSLGGKRESEISVLTTTEADQREHEIDEYLSFRKREHEGQRLNVHIFSL